MIDSHAPRRYSPGDTVRIGFGLRDESGIGSVVAHFIPDEGQGEGILLRGYGDETRQATIQLEGLVEQNHAPGQYRLHYLQATDGADNTSMLHPEPSPTFYVERLAGDHDGPQYEAWGFLD